MNVGVDIDGVIAPNPWSRFRLFDKFWILGKIIRIVLIFVYYLIRSPYSITKSLLEEYKEDGWKIIIISGILEIVRPIIWLWLKLHRIPFDKLVLRKKGPVEEFKIRAIIANRCKIVIEDQPEIVKNLDGLIFSQERFPEFPFYIFYISDFKKSFSG